ncbi:MAG: hypothetical protein GF334_11045 [Candidatus Altiarchaeales archaeon]|nr:hypothetical protein [Candidatus Altiarchaeales archaeon]
MGYSIAIRAANKTLKKQMKSFMENNYRKPHELLGKKNDYSRFTDDPSYDSHKRALGFDFNASGLERDYIFAVCRWMALKIGEVSSRWKKLGKAVPFTVYDGGKTNDDRWPVLVKSEWESVVPDDLAWCLVESTGFQNRYDHYRGLPLEYGESEEDAINKMIEAESVLYGKPVEEVTKTIENELQRLDGLWKKHA